MIEEAAAAKAARIDRGQEIIVGVNKYRLAKEDPIDILDVDNHKVRAGQIARIEKVKAGRDEARCQAALDALRRGCEYANPPRHGEGEHAQHGGGGSPDSAALDAAPPPSAAGAAATSPSRRGFENNLLELAVECARQRATLGEISKAMEDVFGRYGTTPTPVKGVYGGAYGDDPRWVGLIEGVSAVERRKGRRPRMFVAKMGQDGHDRGANLVSSAFGDLGFDIVAGPLFQTPQEAVEMALKEDVDVVGASSLAAGHKTLIPELIGLLREKGRSDIKVVAGGVIPAQDYQALYDAGVSAIFGPGTNLADAAAEVLKLLGHNMPPEGAEQKEKAA
jgi:methylmalonyl-CoA mutase